MSRGPILTIEGLATYLEANQRALEGHEDAICLILYRSELARLIAALQGWEAERKRSHEVCMGTNGRLLDPRDQGREGTGPLVRLMTPQEIDNVFGPITLPAAAAPTPATEPEDREMTEADFREDEELLERMTEDELLAGLEGLWAGGEPPRLGGCVGYLAGPDSEWVCSRCSSITYPSCHLWRQEHAPRPSASVPGGPSCSLGFGIANNTPSTASSTDFPDAVGGGDYRTRKG